MKTRMTVIAKHIEWLHCDGIKPAKLTNQKTIELICHGIFGLDWKEDIEILEYKNSNFN